ncbi:hypothetical protein MSAN_00546500 [Mycena sanguinolenta]|uniref:Uncharacterized protein n=1 Tax=Mycena sanguinolenta TaxID=230812 RepID=A0A8H6Z9Y0_9AGAR|nr:hypothetical protein MSAN_00546500 [Mycena sanguinolenta]
MNLVILDDQSSQITYTGLWTGGGGQLNYDHTASASRAAGATMTFSFSGTSIFVVGSYDPNTSCTGSFALDANVTTFSSPSLSTSQDHQTIFASAVLPDGPHTLTYTLASCSSSSSNAAPGNVWFDYILYSPSANASTNGFIYFIDDNDSRIDYSGNWTAETNNDEDFGLSSHGGPAGSSFQLDFEGTYISVNGRIGNDSVNTATQASFSIDGATPVIFSAPYQTSVAYNQPLFQSSSLAQGKHSLVATSQSGTLWVDYILLQPDPTTNTTVLAAPAHSANIGEIAGAAGGALILILGIALLVIYRQRIGIFKGRRAAPSRPLSRPPNFLVFSPPETTTIHSQPETTTYPPSRSSHSIYALDPRNPFDTPPISPQAPSYATSGSYFSSSSSANSQTGLISSATETKGKAPPSPPFASSSGHSRRIPSLGGDRESMADLKRRQQLAPPLDDTVSISSSSYAPSSAPSSTPSRAPSKVRPLPVIPPDSGSGGGTNYDGDEPPPVYTLE